MQSIIIMMMLACLFPYVFAILARKLGGFKLKQHHQQPRLFLAQLQGVAERANAVQANSFESLVLFLPAVLIALQVILPMAIIQLLCIGYLTFRTLYAICYLANWAILRSIMWWLAFMCCMMLFGLSIYVS